MWDEQQGKRVGLLKLKEKQFNIRKRHAPHYTAFVGNTKQNEMAKV